MISYPVRFHFALPAKYKMICQFLWVKLVSLKGLALTATEDGLYLYVTSRTGAALAMTAEASPGCPIIMCFHLGLWCKLLVMKSNILTFGSVDFHIAESTWSVPCLRKLSSQVLCRISNRTEVFYMQ